MSFAHIVIVIAAGFGAGAINAVAGGGSLVSFPALLAVGLSPITANVTNTIAVWPGYVGSVVAYRKNIADQKPRIARNSIISIFGALVGTVILLQAPPSIFKILVPYLIFAATTLLLIQKPMLGYFTKVSQSNPKRARFSLEIGVFLASIYGSYFGAGLGIMLLSILASFIHDDLQKLNGVKMFLSLVIATVGVIVYSIFASISWSDAGLMAIATLIGGYSGAGIARRLSPKALKIAVIIFGYAIGSIIFLKG